VGNFFHNRFDLFKVVSADPAKTSVMLRQAILAATGEDMEQDVKDACVTISEHESYDFAFEEVDALWRLLNENIGVA